MRNVVVEPLLLVATYRPGMVYLLQETWGSGTFVTSSYIQAWHGVLQQTWGSWTIAAISYTGLVQCNEIDMEVVEPLLQSATYRPGTVYWKRHGGSGTFAANGYTQAWQSLLTWFSNFFQQNQGHGTHRQTQKLNARKSIGRQVWEGKSRRYPWRAAWYLAVSKPRRTYIMFIWCTKTKC